MSDLPATVAAVCALKEPSREVDAMIAVACRILPPARRGQPAPDWLDRNFPEWRAHKNGRVSVVHNDGSDGTHWFSEVYTASVDAAKALMPAGYGLELQIRPDGSAWGHLWKDDGNEPIPMQDFDTATEPIARTAAALAAKIAEEGE